MENILLSGPSNIPAQPTHALICLHGFGADGSDLIDLGQPLRLILGQPLANHLAIFSPNAPQPTPFQQGRQWFRDNGWTFRDPIGLAQAHQQIEAYLDNITNTHGIPRQNMILLGFSQGGMTTLYTVPRLSTPVGGQITIAAMLTDTMKPSTINPTPTLLLHGDADDVVPADRSADAQATYQSWGIPAEFTLLPNLGHGIDANALAHLSVFIKTIWNKENPHEQATN